jgi:hemerythrin superfamily protein
MMIPKFQELSDEQIESATLEQLRAAYRALLAHHIAETEQLWQKLQAAREATR